jgi:hypothetical protein
MTTGGVQYSLMVVVGEVAEIGEWQQVHMKTRRRFTTTT